MIALFKLLPEYIVEWFVANSNERRAEPGEVLICENSPVDSLYIVLSGVLGVHLGVANERRVGAIGTGTVLGEMSFIDDSPSSATVIVEEKSLLLEVARAKLNDKIHGDARFAADFFKALAATLAEKMRISNEKLAAFQDGAVVPDGVQKELADSERHIGRFKDLIKQADGEILSTGKVAPETYPELKRLSVDIVRFFHATLGEKNPLERRLRDQLGARLQHDLLPFILLSDTAERFYSKPRGYAADYLTLERIHAGIPSGKGRTGVVIDRLFLDAPIAGAIRNRREIFSAEIVKSARAKSGVPARILGVACGSARELEQAFSTIGDKDRIHATLIDLDAQALAFVGQWRDKADLAGQIDLLRENVIHLAIGKARVELKPQDLIYSTGLIDYFDERLALKLINFLHSLLAPGGRLILGGFHPGNVSKEFMEYIFEWHVHHRGESEMNALFEKSAFGKKCTNFILEEERVNLYSECVK
jgi:CRP-like cAMP-binding protein/SAM-dependent methyltransferase